jgi:hypothetical protein
MTTSTIRGLVVAAGGHAVVGIRTHDGRGGERG